MSEFGSPQSDYREVRALEALRQTVLPPLVTVMVWLCLSMTLIVIVILAAAPWQQTSVGSGRVVAFTPMDREQRVEAPIPGLITKWYVQEGSQVKAGDILADVSDNDPEILARLEREREATLQKLNAAEAEVEAAQRRIVQLQESRAQSVAAAKARLSMAKNRAESAERALEAAEATLLTARLNKERQQALAEKGLASKRAQELAELEFSKAVAEVERGKMAVAAAKGDVIAYMAEVEAADAGAMEKIESARSSLEKSRGGEAGAAASLAKVDTRLSRQNAMNIKAPRDGTVVRLLRSERGEMVKAGDPVAIFVPDTQQRAVELWVPGNDAPLITPGRHVRLQFEGWPAVQFAGWPSVAIGTFGGVVSLVDASATKGGQFRVVIVPDPEDAPWPNSTYLRQGVRANGWILLEQVRLGYELWRRLNAFPPSVPDPEQKDAAGASGKVEK